MNATYPGANGLHYRQVSPGRYKTLCDHYVQTDIVGAPAISIPAGIRLFTDGRLQIQAGYVWDGPSGPSFHTANFIRGSLYHDALYDLMRQKLLGIEYRKAADELLAKVCKEEGMSAVRAAWVYAGVRAFGAKYAGAEPQAAMRRDR